MKVIIFGATGMVGQSVLRECLRDDGVERVLTVGRSATGQQHTKLTELVHADLYDYSSIEIELTGYDACFFCLGVSSAGMSETDYQRVTYDLTLAAAETLARVNPTMTFIYVSGAGTDSSEHGRSMWARIKGKTENALLRLPFKASYMFRPGFIQPLDGIKSRTRLYRVGYAAAGWLYPVVNKLAPKWVTSSDRLGRAMINVARNGAPKTLLENAEINQLA